MRYTLGYISGFMLVTSTFILIMFGSTACSSETSPEDTATPQAAENSSEASSFATLEDAEGNGQTDDLTEETTEVDTTQTDSENTASAVTAKTKVNLNLRQGPGTNYPVLGNLPADSEVTVIGRNNDASWLVVQDESGEVWLSSQSDLVTVDRSLVDTLPVVDAPAPAFDAGNPTVNRVLNEIPLAVYHGGRHTCASHGGLNNLLPEVANGNVIGPHSGDFVMGQDNVLFEYTNGTFRLIKENPIARFEDDQKALTFEQAMQLFASGDIVWTGSIGDWPARGVTGCDLSAAQ